MNNSFLIFILVVILLMVSLVLVVIFLIYYYQKKQFQYNQKITTLKTAHENEKLKTQIQVQEATFQHIAREIHDNVGQKLSLAKLQLNTLLDTENDVVQNVIQMLTDSLNDLRNLSRSLSSEFIANNGFVKSLENEIEQLNRTGRFNLKLLTIGNPIFLNGDRDLFLFRMVQEGLNNIIKHAEATQIEIRLHYQEHDLEIKIIDNGVGFDVESVVDSNGLKNIKSRAKLLNGSAVIKSVIGNGTNLEIKIPLYDEK